jgi:hypothetical protein
MKLTESRLKRLIYEELLWEVSASASREVHDTAALVFARENISKAEEIIDKIGNSASEARKFLDNRLPNISGVVETSALFGSIKKFTNKLGRPLRLAGKTLNIVRELKRVSRLVKSGTLQPDKALELFGKAFIGEAADQAIAILSLATGGVFGTAVAIALEPLIVPLGDRVNTMNTDLDAAYESANWVHEAMDDPELKSIFDKELPDELMSAAERLTDTTTNQEKEV